MDFPDKRMRAASGAEPVLSKQSRNRLEARSAALSVRNRIRLPEAATHGKSIAESHARPHGLPWSPLRFRNFLCSTHRQGVPKSLS